MTGSTFIHELTNTNAHQMCLYYATPPDVSKFFLKFSSVFSRC